MNLRFLSCIIIAVVFYINTSQAQLYKIALGVTANYTSYGGDYHRPNAGLGFRFSYNFFPKTTITFGYIAGLPLTESKATVEALAKKTNTNPQTIFLKASQHFSINTFYLTYNHFLVNDNEHHFGMYMILGTTFTAVSMTYNNIGVYDSTKYTLKQYTNSKIGGFGLIGGLGGQVKYGQIIVFVEGQLGMPLNVLTSDRDPYYIPYTGAVTAGLKLQLAANKKMVGGQRRKLPKKARYK